MDEPRNSQEENFQPILPLMSESGAENVHYSILYEGLPKEHILIAKKDLKETDEKREKGMKELKEFLESENIKDLPNNILLAALRSCKYDIKKCKSKLKQFASKRREFLDDLAKIPMDTFEKIAEDMVFGVLPYRDKHGSAILYSRPRAWDTEAYEWDAVKLFGISLIMFLLSFPITTVVGFTYFSECDSPSLTYFYPMIKSFKRYCWTLLSLPVRIRRIEILNEIYIIRLLYNVMKPVFPDKVVKRVFFHSSGYERIHMEYDPKILPDVFGGTMGSLSCKLYKSRLLDFIREMKAEEKQNSSRDQGVNL